MTQNKNTLLYVAIILSIGVIMASFILGTQFKNLRQQGVITVKGLAEAQHQSGLASWKITIDNQDYDYTQTLNNNKEKLKFLVNFLQKQGFDNNEIKTNKTEIEDNIEQYRDENGYYKSYKNGHKASSSVIISTKNIELIDKVYTKLQELKAQHQEIGIRDPEYYLENLEKIKRDLIAQATQDAHARAEEFAKTGKAKVGTMKSASQGAFNIYSDNPSDNSDTDEYGGIYSTSTKGKLVRLVVTIEYEIE